MKLCLILGAGASKPYGYPLGFELKQRIIQYCISEPRECALPEKLDQTWKTLEGVAQRLDDSSAPTIDRFLEEFRGIPEGHDYELGQHARMAVAAVLFRHEYGEREITHGWYNVLARHLNNRGLDVEPLKIVTFNYDRSLEHYVSKKLARTGEQPNAWRDADRFRRHVDLHHIYGSLPPLPGFRISESEQTESDYGEAKRNSSAWKAGREIFRFVHDDTDPEAVANCRSAVRGSDVVVVLGFGFDHLNVARVGLQEGNEKQVIISSGYKLDRDTKQRVRATCLPKRIHFGRDDTAVLDFLTETRILEPASFDETNDEIWSRLGSGA